MQKEGRGRSERHGMHFEETYSCKENFLKQSRSEPVARHRPMMGSADTANDVTSIPREGGTP
jgi:hypothetical protein